MSEYHDPLPMGAFNLHRPRMITQELLRHTELLRLLGRLEVMSTQQIRRMIYPTMPRATFYRTLTRLCEEGLMRRSAVPYGVMRRRAGERATPLRHPYVYHLLPAGREFLRTAGAEDDAGALDLLKVRDSQKPIAAATLRHDLLVSWWCSSLIQDLRRNVFCSRIYIQVEFVAHETQRMDALVIARFDRAQARTVTEQIPWFDGTPRVAGEGEIRLALEVDRGTEALKILMEKGRAYRNLTADGTYYRRLGGAVTPVFLVPTRMRARQIAAEWRHVWPDGWGLISTPPAADHPEHGALWGKYVLLTNLQQEIPLMHEIVGGADGRPERRSVMSLAQWEQGMRDA